MIFFKENRKKLGPEIKNRTFENFGSTNFRPGRTGPAPARPGPPPVTHRTYFPPAGRPPSPLAGDYNGPAAPGPARARAGPLSV